MKCKVRSLGTKTTIDSFVKWTDAEVELNKKFYLTEHSVQKALCGKQLSFSIITLSEY